MSFLIEWNPDALREFSGDWEQLDPTSQRQVMDALDEIDYLLINSPMHVGESRTGESDRVLIHPPVSLAYIVDVRRRIVLIVEAHTFKRRA